MKHTAIYMRVSTGQQSFDVQKRALKIAASGLPRSGGFGPEPVTWYSDTASGRTMDRPGWLKLWEAVLAGDIHTILVWKLDRLGRTAAGLTTLFRELDDRGIRLISITEGLDLRKPAGRLVAAVIASVAEYETEIRGERVRAGQAAARAKGKRWGGSKPGRQTSRTLSNLDPQIVINLLADGLNVSQIARQLRRSRATVYRVLAEQAKVSRVNIRKS